MITELIIVVILIVVGAGIAYLGDWIGFTMGKRRLSLFGLRPRHTARVFTAASGAMIALATFFAVMAVVPAVGIAIREGASIIEKNHALRLETALLQRQSTQAVNEALKAQADAASAKRERDEARAQSNVDRRTLAIDNTEITRAGAQLGHVRVQLTEAAAGLNVALAKLTQTQKRSAALNKETVFDESWVDTHVLPVMKEHVPIYENGEEIGRTVIVSGQNVADIKQQIRKFLLTLSVAAQDHGAARGANGRFVDVIQVRLASSPKVYTESDSVDAISDQISTDKISKSVAIIAQASGNAFAGEQADITLKPFANYLAIARGRQLGEVSIPSADDSTNSILAHLQRLRERARENAIQDGVIPVQDPRSGEPVGETPLADLVSVVEQVKAMNGPTTVTAAAARDTYSADQLSLAFTVRAAPVGGSE